MNGSTIVLSMDNLASLLDLESTIDLQMTAFQWYARGAAKFSGHWLELPGYGNGRMSLMAGVTEDNNRLVAKVGSVLPSITSRNKHSGVLVLWDATTGQVLSIMDSTYISAIRTGAAGGLAARYLARQDSRVLGVIGTGIQARFNAFAICICLPGLRQIVVYSRDPDNRRRFVDEVQSIGIPVAMADDYRGVLDATDVVVTATSASTPVVAANDVRPGMHINMMGSNKEIAPDVFVGAKTVVDSLSLAIQEGKVAQSVQQGLISQGDIHAELGDIVLGRRPGRESDEELTIFDSSGIAVQDCVVADYVYEKAVQMRIGTAIDLQSLDTPPVVSRRMD